MTCRQPFRPPGPVQISFRALAVDLDVARSGMRNLRVHHGLGTNHLSARCGAGRTILSWAGARVANAKMHPPNDVQPRLIG